MTECLAYETKLKFKRCPNDFQMIMNNDDAYINI